MRIVVLAGGTGGAKLARGLLDVVDDLTVVANTGDDIEIHGAHVSPDPDLVLFWLADRLDERGWGLAGDTFAAMDRLRARSEDVWFNLGDEDLEIGRDRLRRLRAGERLTETFDALRARLGVRARVLPMCDEPVRTFVDGVPFQEWMIRAGGKAGTTPLTTVELRGIEGAAVPAEVEQAISEADAVVIGPSNPVVSIGPILAVPGMRALLAEVPVLVVSPFVDGAVVKGPTVPCLLAAGVTADLEGTLALYGDVVDGVLTDVWLGDAQARSRAAGEILAYVKGLRA